MQTKLLKALLIAVFALIGCAKDSEVQVSQISDNIVEYTVQCLSASWELNNDSTAIFPGEPFVVFDLTLDEEGSFKLLYSVEEQATQSSSGKYYLDWRQTSFTPLGPKTKGLYAIDFVPSLGTAGTPFKALHPFCGAHLHFSVEGLLDEPVWVQLRKG